MRDLKNREMCFACGYTGNSKSSDFCSECGTEIDHSDEEKEEEDNE